MKLIRRLSLLATAAICTALAACSNPRANPPDNGAPANNAAGQAGPAKRPAASMRPASEVGDRFRTTRSLRVEENTETERYVTESEEVTLTEVLRVDDAGRLMAVRRGYERSVTRITKGYGDGKLAKGDLDGCTLELTRHVNGVKAKLVAGDASIRGANFLIEGFDTGLLPLDPVRESDYWVLEGNRLAGLNTFIEAMQFKIDKNKLTCQVAGVTPAQARVTLDWRLSGELRKSAAVMRFKGELVYDRKHHMISGFELSGGPEGSESQKIEINIKRRPVKGWLDLDR
jgi:hypothetical protein